MDSQAGKQIKKELVIMRNYAPKVVGFFFFSFGCFLVMARGELEIQEEEENLQRFSEFFIFVA